jgi:hypothetical protein
MALRDLDINALEDVAELPRKTRLAAPSQSKLIPFVKASLEADKAKMLPGRFKLNPEGESKTSEWLEVSRELGRAARQMGDGVRVKTRKHDVQDDGTTRVVFLAYRENKSETPKAENKSETNGEAAKVAEKPAATPAQAPRPVAAGRR